MAVTTYSNEKPLFIIAAVMSALFWLALIVMTKGIILVLLPFSFLAYLFIQAAFISHMKGTGALVSAAQFPDIHERVNLCAAKIGMKKIPEVFILHGDGVFNAFATRFLRRDYIILLSDVLDALEDRPEVINFYIGHEMGHIQQRHLVFEPFLSLGLSLPLLGAAYSRAREYTCDLYGAACVAKPEHAQDGLALLAVGPRRYKSLNVQEYIAQTRATSGFWMSFNELIGAYPWLIKRFNRMSPNFRKENVPGRNPFAYILALFVPRFDLTLLIIIYVVMLVGMMDFAKEMKNLTGGMDIEGLIDEAAAEAGVEAFASAEELLEVAVSGVMEDVPEQIDEQLTLTSAYAENGDTLVYQYTVSAAEEPFDFPAMRESDLQYGNEYWCFEEDAADYRNFAIKIVYRYVDEAGAPLGDVLIDTAECNAEVE